MALLQFIVKRKILVSLVTVLVLIVGGYSLLKLDKELMPAIEFDGAYVDVSAGELSAIEVERTITNPLEQRIQGIDGVEDTSSTTSVGRSSINITIETGRGDEVAKEIETVAQSTTADVTAVTDVVTDQYGTSQAYEFYMDVSNGDMDVITAFAEDVLEPRLEVLPEVSDVSLSGIQEYEMVIEFDRDKVLEKGIDVSQVSGVIQQGNSEATLGEFSEDQDAPTLRWNTKLTSVEDIENVQIATSTGFIKLKEIASVSMEPLESSSFVWKNGTKDFIFVRIGRVADVTQIEMAAAVREEIKNIEDEGLIKDFELNEMVAQADYVQESIDGVSSNILIGGLIAVLILLLFLRNIRATIIVGISIPTSILLTFLSMWVLNYSFNMLTLIGLGLGIGMMVDSSIVILESIYRKKEQGLRPLEAVVEGTKEVASAVFASMLTTIVVFLPVGLLGGEMGQFMILLSAVVAITLISSVIVSFTLIPTLSEKFLKLSKKPKAKEGRFIKGYGGLVSWVIKKKRNSIIMVVIFFLMFAGSLLLVPKIPMTIMPDVFNRYSELMVDLETGLSVQDKEAVVEKINEKLSAIEDVEQSYIMDEGTMFYTIINMTKGDDIVKEQKEVNEEIMSALRELEESTPIDSIQSATSAGGGYPVQLEIKGEDFDELQNISGDFIQELEKIEGIVAVNNSIERTSIEQVVELKESAIDDAGLTPLQIRQFIEQAFLNMPIGEITVDEVNVPLIMKWDISTNQQESLLKLKVPTNDGEKELSSFVELTSVDTPNEISHIDGERFVTISADIKDKDLGAINRDVQSLIDDFETPTGYTVSVAGDLEAQQELIQDMLLILGIAIFLVYLVMAVQFNNLAHPIVVMSIIPMTVVGVVAGLFITQRELSVMSGMGIVMLIGIVLNNAILLIDRTNQLRREGHGVNASLVEAGKNRIRPIFMTTLTTAGGMLPLALASGTSGNYQAPMATAIISGLLFATIITLVLIPAVYRIFNSIGNGFNRMFKKKKKEVEIKEIAS
ncbi:efflux RND transporter permease subunit [Metabacillus litoralis]|uniref:Efflux RND transporter permease subunit n=1 Tax=Metabacillus litoralis TaxID=152268 RepID=A0A5C6UZ34_9BACI|nr:efflux RND transporter permease subunit [Metabacillus litoralis]TXC78733.1 efflux RND transporter permease subunit [Metabacillus litoralis]